jgi:hypothetical protein
MEQQCNKLQSVSQERDNLQRQVAAIISSTTTESIEADLHRQLGVSWPSLAVSLKNRTTELLSNKLSRRV